MPSKAAKAAAGVGEASIASSQDQIGEMAAEGGAASAGQSAKGKKGKKKNQKKIAPSLLGFSVESSRILQGELENIS